MEKFGFFIFGYLGTKISELFNPSDWQRIYQNKKMNNLIVKIIFRKKFSKFFEFVRKFNFVRKNEKNDRLTVENANPKAGVAARAGPRPFSPAGNRGYCGKPPTPNEGAPGTSALRNAFRRHGCRRACARCGARPPRRACFSSKSA